MSIDIEKAIEWNDKGCGYIDERNLAQAIEYFKKAINVFPAYAEAYLNIANCYDDLGHIDKAREYYEMAVKCPTDDGRKAVIWENFAIFHKKHGNLEKSKECLSEAGRLR